MFRSLVASAAVAAVSCACGSGTDATGACDSGIAESLQAWADRGFSGTIAIVSASGLECELGFGSADREANVANAPDTVFSIGSVSKAVTAAAVMVAVDDGQLSVDDRAGELLTDLSGQAAEVTVDQLLHHTSGLTGDLGRDHQPLTRTQAIEAASRLESAFPAGTDFLYSNAGYTLLAIIVEQAVGEPYREFVAERVLRLPDGSAVGGFWDGRPATPGPRAVGYLDQGPSTQSGGFAGPHWALAGNGDVAMTTTELALWTQALLGGELLPPERTAQITRPAFDHGGGSGEAAGWVTFDAGRFGTPILAASGGGGDTGHDVAVVWAADEQRVVALASNTQDITAEELIRQIGPALVTGQPLPRPADEASIDPARAAAAAGIYTLPGGDSFELTFDDGVLEIAAVGAQAMTALFPLADGLSGADVVEHEQHVLALLAGETRAGREERALLEEDFGLIEDVTVRGTIFDGGELRTYVTVTSGDRSGLLWYALDDRGGIAAVEGPTPPPARVLVGGPSGTFRLEDRGGSGPEVMVTIEDGLLSMTGAEGVATTARRTE
jgi:CubicO group peptidase (beta-lactamase class C family)